MRMCLVLTFLFASVVSAQAPTADQLLQQLAQQAVALGQCHQQLGALEVLSAQVIGGALQTSTKWRAAFEAANPGQTVSDDFKIVALEQPKGGDGGQR